jgi:hypothetical protein
MDIVFEVLAFLFTTAIAILTSGMMIAGTLYFLEWITNQRNKK